MQHDSEIIHHVTSLRTTTNNNSTKSTTNKKNKLNEICVSLRFIRWFFCPCLKFYSAKVFLILLSLMVLSSTMISSAYLSATSSSLQRQYNMPTSKIGIIISSYDIMSVFAIPLVSYYGDAKINRPRMIAFFSIFYSIGCGVFTFPYFFGEKYTINSLNNPSDNNTLNTFETCQTNETLNLSLYVINNDTSACFKATNDNSWQYYMFIIGQLLMSLGTAPLFSHGITYLCDNLEERSHALFTGFVYGAYALGPALGFLLGSFSLSKWVNPLEDAPLNILESDYRWVGWWWLGFLVSAGMMVLFSMCMMFFPKKLPNGPYARPWLNADEETNATTTNQSVSISTIQTPISNDTITESLKKNCCCSNDTLILGKIKVFLYSLLKLVKNVEYTLIVLVITVESILAAGFSNFMVKFTEELFQVSPSQSSILSGGIIVPSAIIGSILGGLIVKKFNLGVKGSIRLIFISLTLTLFGIGSLLLIRCDGTQSIGIDNQTKSFNQTPSTCNNQCGCSPIYRPMCGSDGYTYVSPCYAGCTYSNSTSYLNCSCIVGGTGRSGECPRDCQTKLIIFLTILFVVIAFEGFCITPGTILILKLVPKSQGSFSLGVMKCINILLAYIPTPIVFSNLIDNTCVLWNSDCKNEKGSCLEYNLAQYHYVFLGVGLGVKVVSFMILIALVIYVHKSELCKQCYSKTVEFPMATPKTSKKSQGTRLSSIRSLEPHDLINISQINNQNTNIIDNDLELKNIPKQNKTLVRRNSLESISTVSTSISSLSSNSSQSNQNEIRNYNPNMDDILEDEDEEDFNGID